MSRWDKYPHIDEWRHVEDIDEECGCCDRPAIGYLFVRHGPMRGSDIDAYPTCQRHLSIAQDNLNRYFGHMRSKDQFLKREPKEATQ